ncbi:uncharacterized protein LOC119464933 [Dermacentor silvarum]|uniref:uncharacterized protein LOC119464933 n=1 Tax=Dermacentor silvarum TaxID=543639 RepID=UPI00189A043B|nr:uncharacterized protein LOC119464933 [Dermacentor silvarum]
MFCALMLVALGSFALVEGSVQYPKLTSCSDGDKITISDMAIQDAQIGKKMLANFTLIVKEPLESNPTLKVTITTAEGEEVGCYDSVGSCSYKMCDGTSTVEQLLGQEWDNACPVPKITSPISVQVPLPSAVQVLIGTAPTTVNFALDVIDGGSSAGCEKFDVEIKAEEEGGDDE